MNDNDKNGKRVTWSVSNFPKKVKDEFVGLSKMQGKKAKLLLENIIRSWVYDQKKEIK